MGRALRLAALACAALIAASCSLTRLGYMNAALAYSNATPVLAWMVGDYVELTGPQRELVRERLVRAFAWHRADELPEYRRFFETVLRQAEDNITVDEARADYRELRGRYRRLLEHVLPDIADFLMQLDIEQAAQMERKFAEDNRKMVGDATRGTPAARLERRVKKVFDHLEEWIGPLGDAQRELVISQVGSMEDPVEDRLADRRHRHSEIVALVRNKLPRGETIAALKRVLVDTDSWRPPEYLKKLRIRDEKLFEMVAALSATLSVEQRAQFQKRVRGFMRDIADLSATRN